MGSNGSKRNSSSSSCCKGLEEYIFPENCSPHRAGSDSVVIPDNFFSLDEVTDSLREHGFGSSNLIIGVDFTKSNEWTGEKSFQRRCLHDLRDSPNPYEQALSIIGKTLPEYDEDKLIPCFGFGDASTQDQTVFGFNRNNEACHGFADVLQRYREIIPHVNLAGPTSFAPIIETAIEIVEKSGGCYHILLIIADGQVTRSVDTERGMLSRQEKETIDAIVKASEYALSIVVVGVGDGPWNTMKHFDGDIPRRLFNNFQFVNFTEIMNNPVNLRRKEADFALAALMEIPFQYQATVELQLLGRQRGYASNRKILPPPEGTEDAAGRLDVFRRERIHRCPSLFCPRPALTPPLFPPLPEASAPNIPMCQTCERYENEVVFECRHEACSRCERLLTDCPFCKTTIMTKTRCR